MHAQSERHRRKSIAEILQLAALNAKAKINTKEPTPYWLAKKQSDRF
jgi:hypothetical protein